MTWSSSARAVCVLPHHHSPSRTKPSSDRSIHRARACRSRPTMCHRRARPTRGHGESRLRQSVGRAFTLSLNARCLVCAVLIENASTRAATGARSRKTGRRPPRTGIDGPSSAWVRWRRGTRGCASGYHLRACTTATCPDTCCGSRTSWGMYVPRGMGLPLPPAVYEYLD